MTGTSRLIAALIATLAAFLVQVTVLPHLAWGGVVPGLVLLVVVGVALASDITFATLLGCGAGLLLDIAPPCDHVAGRWALALLAVGYVVGRLSHDHQPLPAGPLDAQQSRQMRRPPLPLVLAAIAGGSFLGTSVFAFSGLFFAETTGIGSLLAVVLRALVLDTAAGLVVVPAIIWLFTRDGGAPARLTRDVPQRMSRRAA